MKQEEKSKNLVYFMLFLFALSAVAVPVSLYVKKANNPQLAITPDRLQDFTNDKAEFKDFPEEAKPNLPANIATPARADMYAEYGKPVIAVNLYNITRLSKEDLQRVGSTPWSLMNTVGDNLKNPQVIEVIFNNETVVSSFMNRRSVKNLTETAFPLVDMLAQQDYAVENFFTNPVVINTLENETVLTAILNSSLVNNLLLTRAAQYFIDNPKETKALAEENLYLKELLNNNILKNFLFSKMETKKAAAVIYGSQSAQ